MDKSLIIKRIKQEKNFHSDRELAEFLGITTQNLSNWRSRNTMDFELVFTKCEDMSFDWLLKGASQESELMVMEEPTSNYGLRGIPEIQDQTFSELLESVNIRKDDVLNSYHVPLFSDMKADFILTVRDTTMSGTIDKGDQVACHLIDPESFIQWGKMHAIATKSQGVFIRRLKKGPNNDTYLCAADNSEFEPFELPKNEVLNIALVVGGIWLD